MWTTRPLTAEEMAVAEQNAVALGVPLDALMENAGRAVAEEASRHLPSAPALVAVVASTGNNGGDGTCAAFYLLQWGFAPEVWLVRPPSEIRSQMARRCFERIEHRCPVHVGVPTAEQLRGMPLIVDALLGTGQSGPLRGPIRDAVAAIRASQSPVLAIDEPTGIGDPDGLRARWTVTLTAPKRDLTPERAGELVVREIGIPPEAWRRTGPGEFRFLPTLDPADTRGRRARIVVIGGGPYAGAPALAALAALRSGAERATVIAPERVAATIQSFSPNLVVEPHGSDRFRPTDAGEILDFLESSHPSAVLLGMGAGTHPETVDAFREIERELAGTVPLIVDADGLAGLPRPEEIVGVGNGSVLIATPNAGEFELYFGGPHDGTLEARSETARRVAAQRRLFLVVKGAVDLLSDGESVFENRHHDVAMTVGGNGDVLGGVIASLVGQGVGPLGAARLGTWWAGEAGIRAAQVRGLGLLATDVIDALPAAGVAGVDRVRATGANQT
jgi:ADP-dependent NAD(P)H-hydrate dehydratase / NAD(P)H-hydrate epimerase